MSATSKVRGIDRPTQRRRSLLQMAEQADSMRRIRREAERDELARTLYGIYAYRVSKWTPWEGLPEEHRVAWREIAASTENFECRDCGVEIGRLCAACARERNA